MKAIIKPKKISIKNFKQFGDLIDTKKTRSININNGYAKRFDNLGNINTSRLKGATIISIFAARKRSFPMNIKMMEQHPLGSQAFIPMSDASFLIFVAPKNEKPNINKIESFIVPKQTGVNYRPGIWHFPLISLKNMNFLVIDRKGSGDNLIIESLDKEQVILNY